MKKISKEMMDKLILSKYLFNLGVDQLSRNTSLADFTAILNFHDAAELFAQVISDKVGVKSKPKENIFLLQYWDKISKITNGKKELPMGAQIGKLNDLRNLAKHTGVIPSHDSCIEASHYVRNFFDQSIEIFFKEDNLQFDDVSLAELIISPKTRECVRKAEDHINREEYEESSVELAKALEYIIRNYTRPASFTGKMTLIDERSLLNTFHDHIPRFQDSRVNQDFLKIFNKIADNLNELSRAANLLLLGVEPYKYTRFKLLTPGVFISGSGHASTQWLSSGFNDPINQNLENALFCLNFVIDTALRIQRQNLNIIDLRNPQDIIITTSEAGIFEYRDGELLKVDQIKKNEIINKARLTSVETLGRYWLINYPDQKQFVRFEDATIKK